MAATFLANGTYALNNSAIIYIYVNGVAVASKFERAGGAVAYLNPAVSHQGYPLKAGDTVKVYSYCDATSPAYGAGTDNNYFTITRVGNY